MNYFNRPVSNGRNIICYEFKFPTLSIKCLRSFQNPGSDQEAKANQSAVPVAAEMRIVRLFLAGRHQRNPVGYQKAIQCSVVGECLPSEREFLVNVDWPCTHQSERARHADARLRPLFESMKLRGLLEDLPLPT